MSHSSGCRKVVVDEMLPEVMGWFVQLTDVEFYTGLILILMIETFYQMFINAIMGLVIFKEDSEEFFWTDKISIASLILFWLTLSSFMIVTIWFTRIVMKKAREQESFENTPAGSFRLPTRMLTINTSKLRRLKQTWQVVKLKISVCFRAIVNLIRRIKKTKDLEAKIKQAFMRAIDSERKLSAFYFPFFIARRILLSFVALFLQDYPWCQMYIFLLMSLLWFYFIYKVHPQTEEKVWYFELANEVAVMWIFCICLMQLAVQDSAQGRVYIGYVLQPTLLIQLFVNIVTISQVKILYIVKWFKWKIRVARYKAALKIA